MPIVSILSGETSVPEAASSHGFTVPEVDNSKAKLFGKQVKELKQKPGEFALDLDLLKEARKGRPHPY